MGREWEGLFDVCEDPGERHDLSSIRSADHGALRQRLFEVIDEDLDAYRSWRMGSP